MDSLEAEFLCKDGVMRIMKIGANDTNVFGFLFQDRVMTPHGPGLVVGVNDHKLYFKLDNDTAASFWSSCRTADAFLTKGFYKILDDAPAPPVDPLKYHRLKRVAFMGDPCTVVMQGINGPCPVLALSNALLLKRIWPDVSADAQGAGSVKAEELRQKLQELLVQPGPTLDFTSPCERNGTKTIAGVMANAEAVTKLRQRLLGLAGEDILRRFYAGLDVSPCFATVDGFDGDDDAMLFALAGVRLFHSWYIAPDSAYCALREKSYDELQILQTIDDGAEGADLRPLGAEFLHAHQNQSSVDGLQMVHQTMQNGEVAVLFLNNHFGTIVKIGDKLLRLASDESFADKPFCVFEVIWDEPGVATNGYCDGEGTLLQQAVLKVLLKRGNRHTFDDVMLAYAQAISEVDVPTAADIERHLRPAAPSTPPPPSPSPLQQQPTAAAASPVLLLTAPAVQQTGPGVPSPVRGGSASTSAGAAPSSAAGPGAPGGMQDAVVAAGVEQLHNMGFAAPDLDGLLRTFGSVDRVVEYLISQ
jgi:hypothetical protein